MISNFAKIRDEAIKRTTSMVYSLKGKNLSKKVVKDLALKEAKSTITGLNLLNTPDDRLSEGEIGLLTARVTLVSMKSY